MSFGEGPLWHPREGCLFVTDLVSGLVRAFDRDLKVVRQVALNRPTTAMTWQADGSLLCFHDRGEVSCLSATASAVVLQLPEEAAGLFNDVLADPAGRVLCGTQPVGGRPGRLYRIEPDGTHRVLLDDIAEPNGLGLSPDGSVLYFADSEAGIVWRMPYDVTSGTLGSRQPFFRALAPCLPDGLTVDAAGCVWIALWNGSCVVQLGPDGRERVRLALPVPRVTSLTFGGDRFEQLFVTSAAAEPTHLADPGCTCEGAVFALAGLAAGRAEHPSRLRC